MSSNDSPGREHAEIVAQLREALVRATELVGSLTATLATATHSSAAPPEADLEGQLSAARLDAFELSSRLVETEHQLDRLMSLYVASYQLHAQLEPQQVQIAIADIAVNLLGAESFVLLLRKEGAAEHEIVHAQGVKRESASLYAGPSYAGGDPAADRALSEGVLVIGPYGGSETITAVPLRIQDEIVGALVVLKLLEHKPSLRPDDRDLLDLLSAHAASALFAARLFAAKDRKLRTLESLVRLARRE
jgi:hypothetical protein